MSTIKYHNDKFLMIEKLIDALNNSTKVLEFDFYTLSPRAKRL